MQKDNDFVKFCDPASHCFTMGGFQKLKVVPEFSIDIVFFLDIPPFFYYII
jgi:hypothetical protein